MKQIIETGMSMDSLLLFLEKTAQAQFREAIVYVEDAYENMTWRETVSLGLPEIAYKTLVQPSTVERITLSLPNDDKAYTEDESDGRLYLSGSELFCEKIQKSFKDFSPPGLGRYPLMYQLEGDDEHSETLRMLFRNAKQLNAQLFLSSQDNSGKLIRITSSWMLDAIGTPLDAYIEKDEEWAIYHFPSNCAIESSNWFFKKHGLLEKINNQGGMTNG